MVDETPPELISTGTWIPRGLPPGTSTLIWQSPTNPGVSPEYNTAPPTPPKLTSGSITVIESGSVDAANPGKASGVTGPNPVV